MINIRQAQKFCSQPIELIENYEKAVNDETQMYVCHHVWGTMLGYSKEELIELNEYYGIPACNLIFLTKEEHVRLHNKGKKYSEETRKKISELKKGNTAFKGKHHTEESRKKISESHKGEKSFWYGKKHSEETKKKISESQINNTKLSKPILQFTKDGEFVAEYPSISECERETNINTSNISAVLHFRRKSASGYIFKYKQI